MTPSLFKLAPEGAKRDVTVVEKYDEAKMDARKKNAARQSKHRAKKEAALGEMALAVEVLVDALAQAGCAKIVRGIDPMEPGNAIKLLAERIGEGRLIYTKKEEKGARTERRRKQVATARKIAGGKP